MSSLNRVMIIGNLGRDPEVRHTPDGTKVCNLAVATSEKWKDKSSGEPREKSEWHRVTIWGPLAEIAERYLSKGSKAYLSGQLETRKWTDQSGQERYTTEIVLRGPRAELVLLGGNSGTAKPSAAAQDGWSSGAQEPGSYDDLDSSIPF